MRAYILYTSVHASVSKILDMETPVLDPINVVGSQSDAALIHYPGFVSISKKLKFRFFVLCNMHAYPA